MFDVLTCFIPHRDGVARVSLMAKGTAGPRVDVAKVLLATLSSAVMRGELSSSDPAVQRMKEADMVGTIPPGLTVLWGEAFEFISGMRFAGCNVFAEAEDGSLLLLGNVGDVRRSETWSDLVSPNDAHEDALLAKGVKRSDLASLSETLWALVVRLIGSRDEDLPNECVLAIRASSGGDAQTARGDL